MSRKKIIFCIYLLVFAISFFFGEKIYADSIPDERQLDKVVDMAGVLSSGEVSSLEGLLDKTSEKYNCDVAVVAVESLEGKTVTAYADDFYDYNGYGMGPEDSGILLLVSMGDGEWAISTCGTAISVFTDKEQEYIMDRVQPKLAKGDSAGAFEAFARLCDESLALYAKNGKGHDTRNYLQGFLVCGISSGIIALIIVMALKGKMKTVSFQKDADSYIVNGSMHVTGQRDLFLFRNVSQTLRESSPKGGGKSSTHAGASGRSHGGSHGNL